MLDIYAGSHALKTIQQQGFSQQLFTSMLGASGGPKWFTLFGLDKYLFGEFFQERTTPLNLIGSSAGAFRFGALAQKDPVAAISRLAKIYSETVYTEKADAVEITTKAKALLDAVYGNNGIEEIINNPIFKAHFIVAKCQGLTSFDSKPLQFLGLLGSIILNRMDRNLLKYQYQRYVFHHPNSQVKLSDHCQFDTFYQPLTINNLKDALLASGSIPMVMQGVKNIPQAPNGVYRDGGIIDYHFDFLFNNLKSNSGYTEFGKVEEDGSGLRIFLHMFGNLSDPQFGWDKDQKKASRKEQMELEKQSIKSMLKQEFGMFKNDSTINGYKKTPKKDEEFLFYDGDFDQKEEPDLIEESVRKNRSFNNSSTQNPDSSRVRNRLRTNKFFKKLEDEQNKEKKEAQSGFEIGE